ncbi:MAG: GGDEF domain-containing protein [Lachnospiraceae bacterium]|nr:GGDEF domain-containing protein [Lachnospiraceae bacterium]
MYENKKIIALCTSRVFEPQVHGFIEILNETLKVHDCRLWIYALNADLYWKDDAEDEDHSETPVFDLIMWDKTDVVILMDEKIKSQKVSQKIIARANEHSVPVIVVDGKHDNTIDISFDYAKGFEGIVRHVIEDHGSRKPHFMAGIKGNQFSDERLEVFKKVIEENGIAFNDSMVSYGEFWSKPSREATEAIVASGNIPDSIICANDIMAINVSDVLQNSGVRVPEDVIVTGFDGYQEAYLAKPALTTVSCTTTDFADVTAETVLKCLKGERPESLTVLPRLVKNESCGCPACQENSNTALKSFNTVFYRYQDDIRIQHSIAAKMQTSRNGQELVHNMRQYYMPHTCSVVYRNCFQKDGDFFTDEEPCNEYYLLFDWEHYSLEIRPFEFSGICEGIEDHLENGFPLIFNSIDYMNKTMGYVCYSFPNYDLTDYSKTTGISNMISVGLGGYINMQYQQYLLKKVEKMYQIDSLTGLFNRLAFHEAYAKMRSLPENNGIPLTVIMADLDHLKKINDTLGHEAGDRAIAAVAVALKGACPENALCVRFGGDEMLAFIPEKCDTQVILKKISEICENKSNELGYRVSASCGAYATVLTPDTNVDEVIKRADEQMYMIKRERPEEKNKAGS